MRIGKISLTTSLGFTLPQRGYLQNWILGWACGQVRSAKWWVDIYVLRLCGVEVCVRHGRPSEGGDYAAR